MNKRIKLVIFDLDDTFVSCNSTYDFIKYYFLKNNRKKLFWFYIFYFLNFFVDRRKRTINLLKGEPKEKLENEARVFIKKLLNGYIHPEMLEKYRELKEKGYKTFLISASLDFLVNLLGKEIGFDESFGSKLLFDQNNKCLGSFETDVKGKKEIFLFQKLKKEEIDFENSYCFSDNNDDLNLMKLIKNSYGIVKERPQKFFWEKNNIKVLFLPPSRTLNYKLFIIPLYYYFLSRLSYSPLILFFLNTYLLLQIFTLYFFRIDFNFKNLLIFLIAFLSHWNLYEIGYFINDLKAYNEKEPTYRIEKKFKEDFKFVSVLKLIIEVFFLLMLLFLVPYFFWIRYVLSLFLFFALFLGYNFLKEKSNLKFLMFPLLHASHLLVPLIIFKINIYYLFILYMIFVYYYDFLSYLFKKKLSISTNFNLYFKKIILPRLISYCLIVLIFLIFKNDLLLYLVIGGLYFLFWDLGVLLNQIRKLKKWEKFPL